ncbi:helix-turn-helix domain-containing protein [Kitasatospora sp. NPDC051705]|uniref:helix-turn-helix domain-containing protein n=1 Tax=Kitasatospora sp. NPDC051705 TaxID=3364057 RepID=UPI0037B4D9B2
MPSEAVSGELMLVALATEHLAGVPARITNLGLGPVQVSTFAVSPVRSHRTPFRVPRGDPEQYQLVLTTPRALRVPRPRPEAVIAEDPLRPGTSPAPEDTGTTSDGGLVQAIVLQMPRSVLPLQPSRTDRLLARPIPVSGGTGAILADFLTALVTHGPDCRAEETGRLGSIAVDLATACLAQHLGALGEAPAEARARAMRQRIAGFIEHNLGDPDLTPRTIADRHHISLRGLYTLFEGQPVSVAASIRRSRLERCHADLARHELRNHSVQAIAGRWGFPNATVFSRAFREAYGITPTEHRANALRTALHAGSGGPARHVHHSAPTQPRFHGAGDHRPT